MPIDINVAITRIRWSSCTIWCILEDFANEWLHAKNIIWNPIVTHLRRSIIDMAGIISYNKCSWNSSNADKDTYRKGEPLNFCSPTDPSYWFSRWFRHNNRKSGPEKATALLSMLFSCIIYLHPCNPSSLVQHCIYFITILHFKLIWSLLSTESTTIK